MHSVPPNLKPCRALSCRQLRPIVYSLGFGLHSRWPPTSAGDSGSWASSVLYWTLKDNPRAAHSTDAAHFNSLELENTVGDCLRKNFVLYKNCTTIRTQGALLYAITPAIAVNFQKLDCFFCCCLRLKHHSIHTVWHPAAFLTKDLHSYPQISGNKVLLV